MQFFSWVFIIPKRIPLSSFTTMVPIFIISTGNNFILMATIMKQLGDMFSLKDMGSLHFFLGIEVIPTRAGLFLSQHKYVHELLAHTSMSSAKDVSIPLFTTQSLQLVDGIVVVDNSKFCKIIGSLQYLSLTHPDISFAVKKLSQFMHKPTTNHWTETKRLIRYLKQTIFLWYSNQQSWNSSIKNILRCRLGWKCGRLHVHLCFYQFFGI